MTTRADDAGKVAKKSEELAELYKVKLNKEISKSKSNKAEFQAQLELLNNKIEMLKENQDAPVANNLD